MKGDIVRVTHKNAGGSRMSVGTLIDWTPGRGLSMEIEDPAGGDKVFNRHIPDHQIMHVDEMPRVKLAELPEITLEQARLMTANANKLLVLKNMYAILREHRDMMGPPVRDFRWTPENAIAVIKRFYSSGSDTKGWVNVLLDTVI